MTYTVQLKVVAGDGRLARRSRAVLFLPETPADTALVEEFLVAADDDLEAQLTEFVLAHNDEAPPFIFLAWPRDAGGERLHLIVRGDTTINSDIDSVPRLSGTGSSTWVEHRVLRNPDQAVFTSGPPAASDTDLTGGVVPASGFSLALQLPLADATDATAAIPRQPTSPTSPSTPAPAATAAPERQDPPPTSDNLLDTPGSPAAAASADTADEPPVDPTPTQAGAHAGATLDALVALEAAAGGDRLEAPPQPADNESPPRAPRVDAPPVPVAEPTPIATPAPITAPVPTTTPTRRLPGEPPAFPGSDDEVTLTATETASPRAPESQGGDPVTQARMCPNGHPNDPNNANCRLCTSDIDSDAALITVEQPTLARLRLPDGSALDIAGTLVVGRKPNENAARVERATLVALAAPASVSRTHLSIAVDGWRILVTDCESRSGSALLIKGDDEPVPLEPWMAHEVNDGDHLYLGGPTRLVIEEFTAT